MQLRPILLAIMLLAGCSMPTMPVLPSLTPYKMDIQQGNVVTQEMIARLQPGMTRSQVRFALGTPLVADLFHADRWDYIFLFQKAGVVTEQRRIVVIFKDDKLARIEGDVVPASSGRAGSDNPKPAVSAAKPEVAAAKPRPEAAPPSQQVEGANVVTGTGEPVEGSGTAREEKAKEEKPKEREQRGFFGRMLEKLGF